MNDNICFIEGTFKCPFIQLSDLFNINDEMQLFHKCFYIRNFVVASKALETC